jgi:hypothetical protein
MVRGGTLNTEESHNDTQSMIAALGRTTKTRHHNWSRKVRREIQHQQALGEQKDNAWAPTEPPTNDDEVRESDNSDNDIPPGPESSDSENDSGSESDSEKTANVKSKVMHARDHQKREEEERKKRKKQNWKDNKPKQSLLQRLHLPQGTLFQQQQQEKQPVLLRQVNLLIKIPPQSDVPLIKYVCTMGRRVWNDGQQEL